MNKPSFSQKCSSMGRIFRGRRSKFIWLSASCAALALVLISCETLNQPIMAPPSIPGATFVGSKACADCHETLVRDFKTADHSRLQAKGKNAENAGCESCHGPGSLHVNSGGGARTIINPRKDPEACFKCHLEIRSKFNLPYRHDVMEGRMSCGDCHDPHKGSVKKGGGTNLMGKNEVCFKCHTLQRGPFVFQHEAVREGCTTCHDPHGSVNQKQLVARNQMLCLKCHYQQQTPLAPATTIAPGQINMGPVGHGDAGGDISRGACWSGGCHEAIHGSQVNSHLRY